MMIAGLISLEGFETQVVSQINTIMTSKKKKISIIDCKCLIELDADKIKKYLREIKNNGTEILIIKINTNNENYEICKYLQFDVILYAGQNRNLQSIEFENSDEFIAQFSMQAKKLLSFLKEKGIVIINEDFVEPNLFLNDFKNSNLGTITYGFNSKANITTSSIGDRMFDKDFMLYQQKTVKGANGKTISPQEYRIGTGEEKLDIYGALGAVAFAVACGIELNISEYN